MKKVFLVVLILALVIAPAVAASGQVGLTLAPEWFWVTSVEGENSPENTGASSFLLMADGGNYFGKKGGGFGVEYGLGMGIPMNSWYGDVSQKPENSSVAFVFRVGPAYRHEFSDTLGLSASLGFNGKYGSIDLLSGSSVTAKASTFMLGMHAKVAVDVTVVDVVRLSAGFTLGGPLHTQMKTTVGSKEMSENIKLGGVFLAPFLGVSYIY